MIQFIKEYSQYIQWYSIIYDLPFHVSINELVNTYLDMGTEATWQLYLEGIEVEYWSFITGVY